MTASLDTLGGLYTAANPQDLPEGASPRNFDVDYLTGSTFTRAGLASVYTYTATLQISALSLYNSLGTFTYTGKTPTVNESFVLSSFTGQLSFLNGATIFVLTVNAVAGTFTAEATGGVTFGTFTGLSAIANSVVGNFLGPNAPAAQTQTSTNNNIWVDAANILGNVGYAFVSSGASVTSVSTPGTAYNQQTPSLWINTLNINSTGAPVATITLGPTSPTGETALFAAATNFNVPSSATITGVSLTLSGSSSVYGVGAFLVQLANNPSMTPIGTIVSMSLNTSFQQQVLGSSTYLWGVIEQVFRGPLGTYTVIGITPEQVNGNALAIYIQAQVSSGTATLSANGLSVSVYYVSDTGSEELQTSVFNFAVPSTSGISGLGATFQAYSSSDTTVTLQLLKAGVAVGTPKTQTLTTTPTIYTLGAASDLWGSTWAYSDINNTEFGIEVSASGVGVTYINDLDLLTYVIPAQVDFNYIKSYIQNNGDINTLALDASGFIWEENVTSNPGVLSVALSGIIPGSYAKSATEDDQEYIMFSNLMIGTDRPRVASINNVSGALQFLPLSQVGPGAPPSFQASVGSGNNVLAVTAYAISAGTVTFTFTAIGSFTPAVGSLYLIEGTGNAGLDGFTFTVLGTPAPTTTTFAASAGSATGSASVTATATPAYSYPISSITQLAAANFNGQILLWSAGPTSTSPGSTITFYYGSAGALEDQNILAAFNSGNACIVYITGVPSGAPGAGTWLLTGHGVGNPPSESQPVPYFTITYTSSNYQRYGGPGGTGPNGPGNNGTYQITLATLTTASPIADLSPGDNVQITGATPAGWNNSWTIQSSLTSGVLNINSSQMSTAGVATYGFTVQSGVAPINGEIVTTSDLTNGTILNTTGIVSGVTGTTFQITGFPGGSPITSAAEDGQAITFGTTFTFDPGANDVGTTTPSPIFGNDTGTGTIIIVGSSIVPIGAGTRQGVVFFITESGYETAMSPPVTFTTSEDANFINATSIPIGPPNVIARGIAFTEAGQNGVPGANFYVIPNPVVITVGNTTTTYSSTVINDNISTSAKFTFTDAVLLNSEEVDIQGNDLFNLIELGSSAWCVPYASRMFYGLQLNKVQNFNNLSFDGGYLLGVNQPLGWAINNPAEETLLVSPVTGQALYMKKISNVNTDFGLIFQSAYQDAYQVPIIQPNTTYSVRVTFSCPSGITSGNLVIDLTDYNKGIGYGNTYGTFAAPFAQATTTMAVFTGTLLTKPFTTGVSPALQLRVYGQSTVIGADCLIDRIEVFPTQQPYLTAQVYGSYVDDLEAIDASGSGGILDTSSENEQAVMGGFVLHDELYLAKTNSLYSTQDNPNSEPGGWSLREVSNRVGAIGINAIDYGEEWAVLGCRSGVYGFNGSQPVKISQELWNIWETINWSAGNTMVVRNDIVNKRLYIWVPLPTGTNPNTGVPTATTLWLPFSPYNPAPTSPNICFMLNWQAFSTFEELVSGSPVHATMFGTLASPDLRRKYSIWQVPSPYADFITRQNGIDQPLFVCNGINSSKIYQFLDDQLSDDGVAINSLYTTYGFVSATKASTIPIFGLHRKQYSVYQTNMEGAGTASVTLYPDTLGAIYPVIIPGGIALSSPAMQDYFRPLNVTGNRMFIETQTNAVGSWFQLNKLLLTGRSAPWSSLAATGGGNRGVVAGAP